MESYLFNFIIPSECVDENKIKERKVPIIRDLVKIYCTIMFCKNLQIVLFFEMVKTEEGTQPMPLWFVSNLLPNEQPI